MKIGEIRPAWMLIRRDEGHIFVEGVWEIKEECIKYIKNIIPKSTEKDFSYLKTPYTVSLESSDDNYTLEVVSDGRRICFYEYEIIKGKINIGASDPNWYENR